jgi:hypothetical protein
MPKQPTQTAKDVVPSARLEALLDQLVAVQIDLEPVCKVGTEDASSPAGSVVIEACKVLRSAIVDLQDVIKQIHKVSAR